MTEDRIINIMNSAHKLAGQAHQKAEIALVRHDEHEKICAQRYAQIIEVHNTTQSEIKSAKNYLISFLIMTCIGLVGVVYAGVIG